MRFRESIRMWRIRRLVRMHATMTSEFLGMLAATNPTAAGVLEQKLLDLSATPGIDILDLMQQANAMCQQAQTDEARRLAMSL